MAKQLSPRFALFFPCNSYLPDLVESKNIFLLNKDRPIDFRFCLLSVCTPNPNFRNSCNTLNETLGGTHCLIEIGPPLHPTVHSYSLTRFSNYIRSSLLNHIFRNISNTIHLNGPSDNFFDNLLKSFTNALSQKTPNPSCNR